MTAAAGAPVIHGLDHVVVAVRDLAAAVRGWETLLGCRTAWRAEVQGGGAEIAVFRLGNVAVELMAPSGTGETAGRLSAVLDAQGEGLASLAFAVADADRAHRRLARVGLEPEPVSAGESVDRLTGARRRWRRTRASTAATHGVRMFLVETAEPVPVSACTPPAAASVAGLDHVVVRTPDPDRAAALYGARLGLDMRLDRSSANWGVRLMFFRCGDLIVEVAHDLSTAVSADPDRLWGLSWRVPDVAAARARMHGAGLDVSEVRPGRRPGTAVFGVRDGTSGVATLMLGPAPGSPAPRVN